MGSPSGTYRSSLRTFALRRGPGSPHTSGMQGGTPEQRQATRNPGCSHRRSRTPPPVARRVVFHEGMDRDHGGPYDSHAQHHLPPIPDAGPRGPAPNRRTSPPFSRQSSASDRQRFTRAPAGRQTEHPAHPAPPSQGQRPTRCRGKHTPRTRGHGSPRPPQGLRKGWGDSPPPPYTPREPGAMTPVPDSGSHHPTDRTRAPRGPPPKLQHSQTAKARRAHWNKGSTTRSAQGRTQK